MSTRHQLAAAMIATASLVDGAASAAPPSPVPPALAALKRAHLFGCERRRDVAMETQAIAAIGELAGTVDATALVAGLAPLLSRELLASPRALGAALDALRRATPTAAQEAVDTLARERFAFQAVVARQKQRQPDQPGHGHAITIYDCASDAEVTRLIGRIDEAVCAHRLTPTATSWQYALAGLSAKDAGNAPAPTRLTCGR